MEIEIHLLINLSNVGRSCIDFVCGGASVSIAVHSNVMTHLDSGISVRCDVLLTQSGIASTRTFGG